jgi:flavin reductase (DIM6/NTAB) family NADH-FMN oxidoreductase RutF
MSEDPIEEVLRMMPYGFYSITSKADDDVNAMVANWIIQVSFEPRQLALGIQKTCYTRELIERGMWRRLSLSPKDEVRTLKR